MKERVLITGGLGFIFSHVTQYMVKQGYEVMVIDSEDVGSHPEIIDGSFKYFKSYLQNPLQNITKIRQFDPHYIIHAAAMSDVDQSIRIPGQILDANNGATTNVFIAAVKCPNLKKLIYISTDEVYGECEHRKKEDEILFPRNPYACSKAFGSLLRLSFDNSYPELKDKTAEVRMCNIFGPRQDSRKILGNLKANDTIIIHNGGKGYREYLYVKNIPEVVELVMLKGDRVYNITLNEGFTVNELVDKVRIHKPIQVFEGNRPGMDLKYQMDNTRIMELGWKPKYTFEEGLKEYLNDKTI